MRRGRLPAEHFCEGPASGGQRARGQGGSGRWSGLGFSVPGGRIGFRGPVDEIHFAPRNNGPMIPCKYWFPMDSNWCRISSIHSRVPVEGHHPRGGGCDLEVLVGFGVPRVSSKSHLLCSNVDPLKLANLAVDREKPLRTRGIIPASELCDILSVQGEAHHFQKICGDSPGKRNKVRKYSSPRLSPASSLKPQAQIPSATSLGAGQQVRHWGGARRG